MNYVFHSVLKFLFRGINNSELNRSHTGAVNLKWI